MRTVSTEIQIEAPLSRVWETLTGFQAYEHWNPFIYEAKGSLIKGGRLYVSIKLPSGKTQRFTPRIYSLVPEQELIWKGKFLVPGVFDGEHRFFLKPQKNSVRLLQEEKFTGFLTYLCPRPLFDHIEEGFKLMNQALKGKVEKKIGD